MIRKRVVVGLSGGVDSSVAAYLMTLKYTEVIGLWMRNWNVKEELSKDNICTNDEDKTSAIKACETLKIPFHQVDFVKEYWNDVFEPFVSDYENGMGTPNPDVFCNRFIKFDKFKQYALNKFDADYICTGHYAKVSDDLKLYRGVDKKKDQSYFLSLVKQQDLNQVILPLGDYEKTKVRQIANSINLHNYNKPDSMGICFIGKRKNFGTFLDQYTDVKIGKFVDINDDSIELGNHNGLLSYTIGQKAKIEGQAKKYYVVKKDNDQNIIYVDNNKDSKYLYSKELIVNKNDMNWFVPFDENKPMQGKLQIRSSQPKTYNCTIHKLPNSGNYQVKFEDKVKNVVSKQIAAVYDREDKFILCSGKIT